MLVIPIPVVIPKDRLNFSDRWEWERQPGLSIITRAEIFR
jgi:hypothetical protein